MGKGDYAVVELRIDQLAGRELAGGDRLDRFIRIKAKERSGAIGEVMIEADHPRIFIVDLSAWRIIVPNAGSGGCRSTRWISRQDWSQGRRGKRRLRRKRRAWYQPDLRSIQSLPQTLIVDVEERLRVHDGTPKRAPELIQQKRVG